MWKIVFVCGLVKCVVGFLIGESCEQDKILDLPVELPYNFYCENVNFTNNLESFVVPDQKYVVFRNSHIFLSRDFLHRFPNCSEIYFDKVHLELEDNNEKSDHLLSSIFLNECDVSGNLSFFSSLPYLKSFEALHSNFTNHIIGKRFLGNNSNIKVVTLFQNNFLQIDENAFEGISNIEMLTISENLENLKANISEMHQLIYLDLSGNQLTEVPCGTLPANLNEISFPSNKIHDPNFDGCKFLSSLKRLDLSGNGINSLDSVVFKGMTNLEEIYLSNNGLSHITEMHLKSVPNLKKIDFNGNLDSLKSFEGVSFPVENPESGELSKVRNIF